MCELSYPYKYFKENGSFPRIDLAGTCCTNFNYFKMLVFDFSCISLETNILFFGSVESLIFIGSFLTIAKNVNFWFSFDNFPHVVLPVSTAFLFISLLVKGKTPIGLRVFHK